MFVRSITDREMLFESGVFFTKTIISQIHKIRTSPQRDHMGFIEIERELSLKLFFRNIDIYNYSLLATILHSKKHLQYQLFQSVDLILFYLEMSGFYSTFDHTQRQSDASKKKAAGGYKSNQSELFGKCKMANNLIWNII